MKYILPLCCLLLLLSGATGFGQTAEPPADTLADTLAPPAPAPVSGVTATDRDDDHGHAIKLAWSLSPDDLTLPDGSKSVTGYRIMRWTPGLTDTLIGYRNTFEAARAAAREDSGPLGDSVRYYYRLIEETADRIAEAHALYPEGGRFDSVGFDPAGTTSHLDVASKDPFSGDFMPNNADLYYRVDAMTTDPAVFAPSEPIGPVQATGQWFNDGRRVVAVSVVIFTIFTILFVSRARKGSKLYVRPLAGIEAVDDAIGRATEMGKPILYVLGLGTASDIATIASFTILSRVAKRVAEYQTDLIVPTYDPIVMSVAQEVVKSAYMDAGRPDSYHEDLVYFVTQSQFAYVAAVNGTMLRQLPATNVYMGKFYAESLILAETGALAGSIQIAGTDEIAQIPFFVVACDYTLIGEELYAASAYLGGEPILLGSLKAQDYAKALFVGAAVIAFVLMIIGSLSDNVTAYTWFREYFRVSD